MFSRQIKLTEKRARLLSIGEDVSQHHQHDRASPSILKYYVIVHDRYSSVEDAAAQEIFTQE